MNRVRRRPRTGTATSSGTSSSAGSPPGAYAAGLRSPTSSATTTTAAPSRFAHYLAFPLVLVCGVLLIVDLGRPERFWHMLIQSETVPADVQVVVADVGRLVGPLGLRRLQLRLVPRRAGRGRPARPRRPGRRGPSRSVAGGSGRLFAAGGALSAFFLGSYTGVLLSATNQPIWSDTTWLAPLFLASSASTGLAAMILLNRGGGAATCPRRRRAPGVGRRLGDRPGADPAGRLRALAGAAGRAGVRPLARRPDPGVRRPGRPGAPPDPQALPEGVGRLGLALLILAGGFASRAAVVGMPVPWLLAHH